MFRIVAFSLVVPFGLYGLSEVIEAEISCLVKNNPKQLVESEYRLIVQHLLQKAPCNMLVFGVGRDSELWIKYNAKGKTVFLEDNEGWFDLMRFKIPEIDAYLVEYNTKRKDWLTWLKHVKRGELLLDLPQDLLETKWDIIFVDGPEGWSSETPGRMKSIFTAAYLAQKNRECHVFVHDCNRPVEATYSAAFLLDKNLVDQIERLNHYHIRSRKSSIADCVY